MPLVLMLGIGTTVPSPAAAMSNCYEDYMWCLNDTYDTSGFARFVADLKCAAESYMCMLGLSGF
jgi:hypothetical protein